MATVGFKGLTDKQLRKTAHSVVVDDQWNEGYLAAKSSKTYSKTHQQQ